MKPSSRSLWLVPALLIAGCSDSPSKGPASKLPPGVTFSYPIDGQVDVPVGARLIFQLTDAVDAAALAAPCQLQGPVPSGALCVVGAEGIIPITTEVLGEDGTIVAVSSSALRPGESYQIFLRPSLVPGSANLPADAPLVTFRTRRLESAAGAPQLLSVSGEDPAVFAAGGPAPRHPLLDHTTLRLVFSEPLDERSLRLGAAANVVLRRTDGPATDVAANVLLQGPHLVVDPDERLITGATYQLSLTGLLDRGGTALPTTVLTFSPRSSLTYPQTVEIDRPGSASGPGAELSAMSGLAYNSVIKRSPLIGTATLGVLPGTLEVELGDPGAFGGPIPFVLPKGQRLAASELALKLAGVIELGYETGSLYFDLVSDANGWVTRNSYRAAEQTPDDRESPLMVDLYFDAALIAEDPTGNGLATQTLLNIHLTGEAISVDGQLVLEVAGAIEVDLLGVSRSTADLSLRLRTGAVALPPLQTAPTILGASPARGDTNVSINVRPQILLSSAVDLGAAVTAGQLVLRSAAGAVPAQLRAIGGALVVVPSAPLLPGTAYTISLGALHDVGGREVVLSANDATAGTGEVTFTTAATPGGAAIPPQLAALSPGAPCPLTGATPALPGRCVGGLNGDPSYQAFTLAADRPVEARFTQPMSAATMRVGAACGQGAIRVEVLNGAGACTGVVAGEVTHLPNGFRFMPIAGWTVGGTYRLVLSSGTDDTCATASELCGANGRPLNTDPLADSGAGTSGGPVISVAFTATAPLRETQVTAINLTTIAIADRNANGVIDTGEARQSANELAVDVESTGGIVSAASTTGADCHPELAGNQVCLGVTADLPVTVLPALTSCPIDASGVATTSGGPCVPVRISAQGIRTTSLTLAATATVLGVGIDLSNIQTGMMHIRLLEPDAAGAVGYIMSGEDGRPRFVVSTSTLMDAPDLNILAGLVSHDVTSKPVSLVLAGPVSFLGDGRMQVVLHNLGKVVIPVNISTAGFDGRINLRVPDGTLSLTLNTPALR